MLPSPLKLLGGGRGLGPPLPTPMLGRATALQYNGFCIFPASEPPRFGESVEIVYFLSTKTADWQEREFQVCLFKIGMEWENLNTGTPKIINFPFGTNGK